MRDFTLRPWSISDLDSLVKYANNSNIAGFMNNQFPHPYTKEAGTAFINYASAANPPVILAIDIDGEACGGIGIHPQQEIACKNAEMGYWLGEPFWGKGIITRAVQQMSGYGFKHLDINRIFARPFGSNIASQKVLEKAGFILEARFEKTFFKNGVFEDELVYGIRK